METKNITSWTRTLGFILAWWVALHGLEHMHVPTWLSVRDADHFPTRLSVRDTDHSEMNQVQLKPVNETHLHFVSCLEDESTLEIGRLTCQIVHPCTLSLEMVCSWFLLPDTQLYPPFLGLDPKSQRRMYVKELQALVYAMEQYRLQELEWINRYGANSADSSYCVPDRESLTSREGNGDAGV
jgi:hypothetical protein